ncbi:hypothetical protein LTR17_000809 [Elasticomyces elasticus]|nr:hypothetical protein LTR17_000809 [Elasticomyces elasticus]
MGNTVSSSQSGLRPQPSAEPLRARADQSLEMAQVSSSQQSVITQAGSTHSDHGTQHGDAPGDATSTHGSPDGDTNDRGANTELLHTRNFYVLAAVMLAANIALLVALIYLLVCIDEYRYHRRTQTLVAWLALWLGVFLLFTISGWLKFRRIEGLPTRGARDDRMERVRGLWARTLPAWSIIGTELFAILAIVGYFYGSATKTHFELIWDTESDIVDSALAPGFALFGDYDDAVSANFTEGFRSCSFPVYSNSCDTYFSDPPAKWTEGSPYGTIAYYTLNASDHIKFTAPGQQLKLQANVIWDSDNIMSKYKTKAPQNPSLYTVMYDPRLTDDQFRAAIKCGIIGLTEQPALGSSTYTIDQVTRTHDTLGKLTDRIPDSVCKALAETLYKLDDGFVTYRYHLTSSGTSYADVCDKKGTDQFEQACVSQVIVRFGSFSTTKLISKHGNDIKDIILDMGSIVGAIHGLAVEEQAVNVEKRREDASLKVQEALKRSVDLLSILDTVVEEFDGKGGGDGSECDEVETA